MHMTRPNRVISTTAAAALAMVTLTAVPAFADGSGGDSVLSAPLMGSTLTPVSPMIARINPGAAQWVNGPSLVRVREDGRITVTIRGLVIPKLGGTNPVTSVVATLVCENMLTGSTQPFALSAAGNGSTSDKIPVPRQCEDPAVLIRPFPKLAVYIASAMGEDD